MKYRHRVLALLILLFAITYLDRVCISVAGPRMQEELHLDPSDWGWVTGMFAIAYCVFEIPSGTLGDRIGPHRVLTRIVLWWSAFTAMTGMASNYPLLLATRFAFGAGEAGVFPNSSIVVARWFPSSQRATISGATLMAAQVGGALAPLLIVPIQAHYGWRMSFYLFGAMGVIWAVVWYVWFRDTPAGKPGVSAEELQETAGQHASLHNSIPWRAVLGSRNGIALMVVPFLYSSAFNFFQTWIHTFLVKGRGFHEADLWMSSIPYVAAAIAVQAGGMASDSLVRRLGAKRGRRTLGVFGMGSAALFAIAVPFAHAPVPTIVVLSLIYASVTFQQAGFFGACLDIGHRRAGALIGMMNTSTQFGGLLISVGFGYLVEYYGSYNVPFAAIAVCLALGAVFWFWIDPTEELAA